MKLTFFTAPHMALCFVFVTKAVLITHQSFGCCWAVLAQHQGCLRAWVYFLFFFFFLFLIKLSLSTSFLGFVLFLPCPAVGWGMSKVRQVLGCWLRSAHHSRGRACLRRAQVCGAFPVRLLLVASWHWKENCCFHAVPRRPLWRNWWLKWWRKSSDKWLEAHSAQKGSVLRRKGAEWRKRGELLLLLWGRVGCIYP